MNPGTDSPGPARPGLAVLTKVYADRHIVKLPDLLEGDELLLPPSFRHAVAVTFADCEIYQQQQQQQGPLLKWCELIESCESSLVKRGLRDKWHLPYLSLPCECPFVAHAPPSDWHLLHNQMRTAKTRWLLTHCSIFIPVANRAWLRVSGPCDRGLLDKTYPHSFAFSGLRKTMKRKRVKELDVHHLDKASPAVTSVQRPLKKIRLADLKVRVVPSAADAMETEETPTPLPARPIAPNSLVPRLKRVRLHRANESPIVISLIGDECKKQQASKAANKRRAKVRQIADKRRAIDGSILIAHDELLYSGSGWTHFPIAHPLCRSTAKEAVLAILATPVGTDCRHDAPDLRKFHDLVETMRKNHAKCPYTSILRKLLASSPEYDAKSSCVPVERVNQFIKCVMKRVVPVGLLGGERNFRTFLSNVRYFVRAGKGSSFTLAELIMSMRTGKCAWLRHLSSLPLQISLVARLVMWLFVDFVKPIVRQHFYATESSHGRNRIYFYAKDAWQRMKSRMMRCVSAVSLKHPVPFLAKCENGQLEKLMLRSRIRFVPKNSGHRPIMSTKFRGSTVREIVNARLLLHSISGQYPEGMDAKSTQGLHRKWLKFLRSKGDRPTYFVHADVEDAFGSINHDKLVDILRLYSANLPERLTIRTACTVTPDGRRSRNFKMIPYFHAFDAESWVQRLAPGCVLFDLPQHETLDTAKVIEFVIRSIREVQVVHAGKEEFRLMRGIPQGSRLSSALCHIYYGQMVREHLAEFLHQEGDLLVRVVDDFLYLTTDEERARRFHRIVHQGFPDYNAYVNVAKSVTNVDLTLDGPGRPLPATWVSFCGLQFNSRTLETRGDYTKYEGADIIQCITPSAGQPGKLLLKRLQGVATLDSAVNRKPTVVRSVYHACLMAAFRFHAIVRHIVLRSVPIQRRGRPVDARFLAGTVIRECCTRMIGYLSAIRRRRTDVKLRIGSLETAWLCYEAFRRKLVKHRAIYVNVLQVIHSFQAESERKLARQQLDDLRKWIGKRAPRSFRRMKHKRPKIVNKACN